MSALPSSRTLIVRRCAVPKPAIRLTIFVAEGAFLTETWTMLIAKLKVFEWISGRQQNLTVCGSSIRVFQWANNSQLSAQPGEGVGRKRCKFFGGPKTSVFGPSSSAAWANNWFLTHLRQPAPLPFDRWPFLRWSSAAPAVAAFRCF